MPGYVVLSGEKVTTTDLHACSSRVLAEHALPRAVGSKFFMVRP